MKNWWNLLRFSIIISGSIMCRALIQQTHFEEKTFIHSFRHIFFLPFLTFFLLHTFRVVDSTWTANIIEHAFFFLRTLNLSRFADTIISKQLWNIVKTIHSHTHTHTYEQQEVKKRWTKNKRTYINLFQCRWINVPISYPHKQYIRKTAMKKGGEEIERKKVLQKREKK